MGRLAVLDSITDRHWEAIADEEAVKKLAELQLKEAIKRAKRLAKERVYAKAPRKPRKGEHAEVLERLGLQPDTYERVSGYTR